MAKKKAKIRKKETIKIVIEKRVEPLRVPDLKVRDFPKSNINIIFNN